MLQTKLRANTPQMAKVKPQPTCQLHRKVSHVSLLAVMYTSLWKTRQQTGACVGFLPQCKDMHVITGDMWLKPEREVVLKADLKRRPRMK